MIKTPSGNVGDLIRMIGTGKGSITKTIRLSTIHDLPNVVGGGKGDVRAVARYEPFPVFLENPLERKMAFSDGFHDELNFTSVPDDATNCPVGALCSYIRRNFRVFTKYYVGGR